MEMAMVPRLDVWRLVMGVVGFDQKLDMDCFDLRIWVW